MVSGAVGRGASEWADWKRAWSGIRWRSVSVVLRPLTRASQLPVIQLVFVARGAFPLSTTCVCAFRGFLPGRVFPDRTTQRHGQARLSPNWVGFAGRVDTVREAAEDEGDSVFIGAVAVRQPASGVTWMVQLTLVRSAVGGAPQRQDWLSPARSMTDEGGHGDPPGVEVLGVGGDGTSPPEGGSSVVDRPTSAGPMDLGACGERSLVQPLSPGLDPTRTFPMAGEPSGCTHLEAAASRGGTHFGGGQTPDVNTWGGGSVPPPAQIPAGASSSFAPPGSRSAKGAPAREHGAGNRSIGPKALGLGGRSPLGAWDGKALPESAWEPAGWSSRRDP